MQHSWLFNLISRTQRLCRQWQCEVCQLIADRSWTKLIFANSAKHTILIAKRRQNSKNWRGPQWQKQRQIALRRIPEPFDTDPWLENKNKHSIFTCPDSHISKISNISLKVQGRLSVYGHFVNLLKRRQRKPRLADGLISAMETEEVSGAYGNLEPWITGQKLCFWAALHQSISCSQNSPPKTIYNIFQLLVVPYPILYLTLRSSSSLTVQNLHRRSKFTQITGRLGELFPEQIYMVTWKQIEFIGFMFAQKILLYRSLFLLFESSQHSQVDTRRLDAIQKEAFLEGMLASLGGGMSNVPAMPRGSTHGYRWFLHRWRIAMRKHKHYVNTWPRYEN